MALAFDSLAGLLAYPANEGRRRLVDAVFALDDPRGALRPFDSALRESSAAELEELFTRTFDINPVCTLEVGWHIFGEEYDRGALLVQIRGLLKTHGIDEGAELPDHLATMLRLLGRLPATDAGPLARRYVLPALGQMLAGFQDETNPYRSALTEIEHLLRAEYGEPEALPSGPQPYDCAASCPALKPNGG